MGRAFDSRVTFLATLAFVASAPIAGEAGSWSFQPAFLFLASLAVFAALATRPSPGAMALASILAVAPSIWAGVRSSWISVSPDHLLANLFGAHGVLYGGPLLWTGYFGLIALRHEDQKLGRLSLAAVGPGTLSLLLSTESADLPMRVATWLPFLLPGMAQCFQTVREGTARRPERALIVASFLLVLWNGLFMEQYRLRLLPSDDTVSFAQVAANSAGLLSRAAGTPFAWPANWIFSRRFHASPDQWDAVADRRLFASPSSTTTTIEVGDDASVLAPDLPLLLEGFGARRTCGPGWCRDFEGAGRLLLPIQNPGTGDFLIRLRVRGQGALRVSLHGARASVSEMTDTLSDVLLRVPSGAITSSLNVVSLSVAGGGRATLDRITLERDLGTGSAR
jgi:hypothetical protein